MKINFALRTSLDDLFLGEKEQKNNSYHFSVKEKKQNLNITIVKTQTIDVKQRYKQIPVT